MSSVRKVPGKTLFALAGIRAAVLKKNNNDAAQDFRRVTEKFPDLKAKCLKVNFHARKRQPLEVSVGNLALVVEYIMLLPGRTAASVRTGASKLLVRYLGG